MINDGPLNSGALVSPSGEPVEFEDWSAFIDPLTSQTYYAMELDDGVLDPIRIPISSWQATAQLERSSYAQCVIPAATQWVAAVAARANGEFIIYRGVRYADGQTQEAELARAPMQTPTLSEGPTNVTLMLQGYAVLPPPTQIITRTLKNVRSESTTNGLRVRCDIDWFLRPGQLAVARGTTITVGYINYYVAGGDQYMDVGERVE